MNVSRPAAFSAALTPREKHTGFFDFQPAAARPAPIKVASALRAHDLLQAQLAQAAAIRDRAGVKTHVCLAGFDVKLPFEIVALNASTGRIAGVGWAYDERSTNGRPAGQSARRSAHFQIILWRLTRGRDCLHFLLNALRILLNIAVTDLPQVKCE